ncbi:hypothetical protein PA598K_01458 [Paenibacillus sp. 598K]|uniref:hypothetical protein n=1 Tax=Paenibacillus sp. 598K TaxID=1117987 RepID=UPI000FFA55BD|nr:hypothetical protein [Paenibacillus sp. 598K]GBF73173.1 hypothetical protein PA598K_01458 [Paenibacillus sp. 598K]
MKPEEIEYKQAELHRAQKLQNRIQSLEAILENPDGIKTVVIFYGESKATNIFDSKERIEACEGLKPIIETELEALKAELEAI